MECDVPTIERVEFNFAIKENGKIVALCTNEYLADILHDKLVRYFALPKYTIVEI